MANPSGETGEKAQRQTTWLPGSLSLIGKQGKSVVASRIVENSTYTGGHSFPC